VRELGAQEPQTDQERPDPQADDVRRSSEDSKSARHGDQSTRHRTSRAQTFRQLCAEDSNDERDECIGQKQTAFAPGASSPPLSGSSMNSGTSGTSVPMYMKNAKAVNETITNGLVISRSKEASRC